MAGRLISADSPKKNYIYQFIYQAIVMFVPLILSPYLTRTLGSTALGKYTYTYSIAYYFVIIGMLGINRYGQRIIAQRKNDAQTLRKTFWSLYAVHMLSSLMAVTCYLIYVLSFCGQDKKLAFVQTAYVMSALFDMTFLFYGFEKFKIVAMRNAVVKLCEVVLIFSFVKSPDRVIVYAMIMGISVCAGHMVMFPQILASIPPIKIVWTDMKEHIKPMLVLFSAVVAATLYTMFDKTLLGLLSTKENVAFYEYADKIIVLPKTFISIAGIVLFPEASRMAINGDYVAIKRRFKQSLMLTCFMGFGVSFGLLACADLFALIYYGEEFAVCGHIMKTMCPLILLIGIGDIYRMIYIYPQAKDTEMVKILFINSIINLALSYELIPFMGVYGAVIGTIAAECFGLIAEMHLCKQYVTAREVLMQCIPFGIFGLIMFVCVLTLSQHMGQTAMDLILQIIVGIAVFSILSLCYLYTQKKEMFRRN